MSMAEVCERAKAAASEEHALALQVNDLVAYEYLDEKRGGEWSWGLGTVAMVKGPRVAQLYVWDPNTGIPEEEEEEIPELAATRKAKQEATEEAEHVRQDLREKERAYREARAAFEEDLHQAQESLKKVKEEVHHISEKDWREIRSYVKPPAIVELVIGACMVVLGEHATKWSDVLKVIRHKDFVRRVEEYDASSMSASSRRKLKKEFLNNPRFTYENAMTGSRALGVLHRWVTAQGFLGQISSGAKDYDLVNKEKKEAVDRLTAQLDALNKDISELEEEEQKILDAAHPNDSKLVMEHGDEDGAAPKETVRGLDSTFTFTDRTRFILRAAILVNFGPTDTMVKTLVPEEVEQLASSFKERAPPLAQEQRAEAERRKLQKDLDDARKEAAEAQKRLDELAEELERLREQQPPAPDSEGEEEGQKDEDEGEGEEAAAERVKELEDEIQSLKDQLEAAKEREAALPSEGERGGEAAAQKAKEFGQLIDDLDQEAKKLKSQAAASQEVADRINDVIAKNEKLKSVMEDPDDD